ncbi:MAG: DUF362 domain-containing protein [Desulfobacteraceae bacterium]
MSHIVAYSASSNLSIDTKVEGILSAIGGMSNYVKPGNIVLIKPNFVAPFPHATTSLEVLGAIITAVKHCGGKPVIAESAGYEFDTEVTFKLLGAYDFARKIGVKLINLDKAKYIHARLTRGFVREVKVPKLVLEADVLINVPKLKRHSLTSATISMKNLVGFLHRESRCKIHCVGLEQAIFELSKLIHSHLVIVDGTVITGRAVFGSQHHLSLLVGSDNTYAADVFCCRILGVNPRDIKHIRHSLNEGLVGEMSKTIPIGTEEPLGDVLKVILPESNLKKNCLLHIAYRLMYSVELLYTRIMNARSLIPAAHYYFGIRPWIDRGICDRCGICLDVCPVDAIKIQDKEIDASLCMKVRCMQCLSVCPHRAIRIRGRKMHDASIQLD